VSRVKERLARPDQRVGQSARFDDADQAELGNIVAQQRLDALQPAHDPWDQPMCMVPDGDSFLAIQSGKADVVTDHIEAFTESGIQLRPGARLEGVPNMSFAIGYTNASWTSRWT
jgi:cation diffusion facilitator CzcD-associated flavoprotein CzcO